MAEDGKVVYKVVVDSTGATSDAERAGQQIGQGVQAGASGTGTSLGTKIGQATTKAAAAAVKGGFKLIMGAIETGMDFDATMSQVRAISGATNKEFDELRANALEMARTSKFTATESASALSYMAMAGWNAQQMIDGLPGIMYLAAAGGEDLATTSDIVTDALTAFGKDAEYATHFADVLAMAAARSNTNVAKMGETFKYVAPQAGQLGYSVDDVAVAIGLMANSGVKASMAGTALRGLFTRLLSEPAPAAEALSELGISLSDEYGNMYSLLELLKQMRTAFSDVEGGFDANGYQDFVKGQTSRLEAGEITEEEYEERLEEGMRRFFKSDEETMGKLAAALGGQRALSGLLALVGATDEDFDRLAEAIGNASGQMALLEDGSIVPLNQALAEGATVLKTYNGMAEAMSDTMLDNLAGDVTLLKSAWEGFQVKLSDKFTPEIRRVMPRIIEAVGRLTEKLDDIDLGKLADGLADLAEKAIDFIGYLLDHSDEVIEFVKGIGAALATAIIGSKVAGGVKSAGDFFGMLFGTKAAGAVTGATVSGATAATGGATATGATAATAGGAGLGGIMSGAGWASAIALPLSVLGFGIYGAFDTVKQRKEAVSDALADAAELEFENIDELRATEEQLHQEYLEANRAYQERDEQETWQALAGLTPEDGWRSTEFHAEADAAKAKWEYVQNLLAQAEAAQESADTSAAEVGDTLGGMADEARGWGVDMMTAFAAGLSEGANGVLLPSAIGIAAGLAALFHHTEPDIGPLAGDSQWMPDMMRSMAAGIDEYGYLVTDQLAALAGDMAAAAPTLGGYERSLGGQIAGGAGGLMQITVPVSIDGTEVARATAWAMGQQMAWEAL